MSAASAGCAEIEAQWGPAPGRQQSDGGSIFVLGERFGNVLVGVQPAFGYEGDPMRLLFEKGFAPTHAFSAFYRYLREDFGAHAVLHFGTHGALEFMPGKQTGLSAACWPDRLIGDLPELLPLRRQQPVRGHDRQAARGGDADQLSHPAGGPGRPLPRPARPQGLDRALARAAAGRAATSAPQLAPLIQAQAAAARPGAGRAGLGRRRRGADRASSATPSWSSNTR